MKSITGSYSSAVRAAECKPAAIWISEFAVARADGAALMTCPPLTATTSPCSIASMAIKPRPAIWLSTPFAALGGNQKATTVVILPQKVAPSRTNRFGEEACEVLKCGGRCCLSAAYRSCSAVAAASFFAN